MRAPETAIAEAIPEPVREFTQRLLSSGNSVYLVGGAIRDALMFKTAPTDLDFATSARPDEIEAIAREFGSIWLQGREFGTIGVEIEQRRIEVTTFRSEVYQDQSRKPRVTFGDSIEEDLARRDFTVNALALALPDWELVDPYGGVQDLADGRLRTPLEPEVAFGEDPLRLLRAARFVSQLGLDPDPALIEAARRMSERLRIVSAERIRDELSKLLVGEYVDRALWMLVDLELADHFLPELPALRLEQDPVHRHKDVLAHTIAVVAKTRPDFVLRMAALLHDIGKPRTRSYEGGKVSFHHHEAVGARMARDRLGQLRYPKDVIEKVSNLVFLHLRFHTYAMGWSDKAVRRYVRDAGDQLRDLNELVRADCTTRNLKKAETLARRMDDLERRIEELRAKEEIDRIRPPIDGRQVMERLGIGPGPLVGEALDYLLEARLDQGPIEESRAFEMLDEWAEERGLDVGRD